MYKLYSQEYQQFAEEYEHFLHQYTETQNLCVLINTNGGGKNTQNLPEVYKRAVEAHIDTTNTFLRLVAIYKLLVQKCLDKEHP